MNTSHSFVILAAALLAALTLAAADDGCLFLGNPDVAIGQFYIDNDQCQPQCAVQFVVYEESNGVSSLQRFDAVRDDTCDGLIRPDSLILFWTA
jgi:hypothetical protein